MKSADGLTIASATARDVAAIRGLLLAANLPHEDFAPHVRHFVVARQEDRLIGAVGAEVYGSEALLRSLVVAPTHRGTGVGNWLLAELEQRAASWGVCRWWLLTTTAETFFAARGFRRVPRTDAPAAVAATAEFRELCPSIATCMTREVERVP